MWHIGEPGSHHTKWNKILMTNTVWFYLYAESETIK